MKPNDITYNCIISACLSRVTSDRLRDVVARQADGVKTDHYTMSIGLNALSATAAPGRPSASWHCWTPAGSTICPEEVLRNTVLEFGIQGGEPNRQQVLLTAREHFDLEPSPKRQR